MRQARENRLVYVILAEYRLVLPEAQAPQPDHDVHNQRPPSGVALIMVCLGECVQAAHVSGKAEADSYPATVRPRPCGLPRPPGVCWPGGVGLARFDRRIADENQISSEVAEVPNSELPFYSRYNRMRQFIGKKSSRCTPAVRLLPVELLGVGRLE